MTIPDLEVFLPVCNEAESIEGTIRELYNELSSRVRVGFIICEDGSTDNTKEILRKLEHEFPLRLNLLDTRRGYSRAAKDGMRMLQSEYLLCVDSDGQCDPMDFWQFWDARQSTEVVLGRRVVRADSLIRRACSRLFYCIYQLILRTPVHDPSCPYVLIPKCVAVRLVEELGVMQEGFWWEFVARVHRRGFKIKELSIRHRLRLAGVTKVYNWKKMPGIFLNHTIAIFQIWLETRS